MICDICKKNAATVHLTEIVGNKIVELHLCQNCADMKTEAFKDKLSIPGFLSGGTERRRLKDKDVLRCPFCGLSFTEFRKKGRLGCHRCYEVFRDRLFPLLRRIHGAVHHVGRCPGRVETRTVPERSMKELKERLARAVKLEEYEEAARIRDQIKNIESKSKDGDKDV